MSKEAKAWWSFVVLVGVVVAQQPVTGTASCDETVPPLMDNAQPQIGHSIETVWASVDYLLWWSKNAPRPGPLAATGPATDLFPGALDQPNTRVLYGNQAIGLGAINGGRARLGMWLDSDKLVGVEVSGLLLERVANGTTFTGDANGQPYIGRPFTNALTGNPNIYFVSQNFANPAISALMTGRLDMITTSRFWAWDANAVFNLSRSESSSLVGLAGFKSLALDEHLLIDETIRNLTPVGGVSFGGVTTLPTQTVQVVDDFRATNRFYGGQIGGRYTGDVGSGFVVDLSASCALGMTRQEQTIVGATSLFNGPNRVATLSGGVLALPSNSGNWSRDVFSVVPEGNVNIGYRLTSWLTARVGYSFLYWSDVVRPTQQLDTVVNPNRVPSDGAFGAAGGPARPNVRWNSDDYWLHGVNFSIDVRW